MSASTIYNSYSIALPSVQVAVASGQGLLSRWIEALARRIVRSIVEQPPACSASAATLPSHWRTEAALRQQGMRDWLSMQPVQHPLAAAAKPGGAAGAAQAHKELWLELIG